MADVPTTDSRPFLEINWVPPIGNMLGQYSASFFAHKENLTH